MGLSLSEQYFIRAVDEYPYNLEEVFRNIELVLTNDQRHAGALCLLARVYHEQLERHDEADQYFRKSLSANPRYAPAFSHFIAFLLEIGEVDQAEQFLKHARKLKGIKRAQLHLWQAQIWELRGRLQEADAELRIALSKCLDSNYFEFIENERNRIEKKMNYQIQNWYVVK